MGVRACHLPPPALRRGLCLPILVLQGGQSPHLPLPVGVSTPCLPPCTAVSTCCLPLPALHGGQHPSPASLHRGQCPLCTTSHLQPHMGVAIYRQTAAAAPSLFQGQQNELSWAEVKHLSPAACLWWCQALMQGCCVPVAAYGPVLRGWARPGCSRQLPSPTTAHVPEP